jgi:Holliday junction resolvase RusA-like endonuclease
MDFEIFIPIAPIAKGRPEFARGGFAYTPQKTRMAEHELKYWLIQAKPPLFDKDTALFLELRFDFIKPKSAPKKRKHPIVRPDFDNLTKLTCDAMNKLCYHDDAQIVRVLIEKRYSDNCGIFIRLSTL